MNNKKKSNWTVDNKAKYKTLFNYLTQKYGEDKVNEETYINDYKKKLMKEIEDNPKWGLSMRENCFFMIAKWLSNKNPKDRYAGIFHRSAVKLEIESKKETGKNQLDPKEQKNFRDYSYFENILKNKDKFSGDIESHYGYLLLACLIWQPPLRTGFYQNVSLLKSLKDDDGRKQRNSLSCSTRRPWWYS